MTDDYSAGEQLPIADDLGGPPNAIAAPRRSPPRRPARAPAPKPPSDYQNGLPSSESVAAPGTEAPQSIAEVPDLRGADSAQVGGAEDDSSGIERASGRRRRSRRGRQPSWRPDDGMAERPTTAEAERGPASPVEGRVTGELLTGPGNGASSPVSDEAGSTDAGTAERSPELFTAAQERSETDAPGRRDRARHGYYERVPGQEGRQEGSSRRDWRNPAEVREFRDTSRRPLRDRQAGDRNRSYQTGRDGRPGVGRDSRDGQGAREPREAAGYREPAGYHDAETRERTVEGAPAARAAEVVTRGYVIAIDQNQNQWQLRTHGHLPSPQDATVPLSVIRNFGVRSGDEVVGLVRSASGGRRFGELLDVQTINGVPADRLARRPHFDDLTPIYPERHMRLERPESVTARLIDIVCPVGFGQRALIVSPPKAGKTTILKEIGRSVNTLYPEVKLIVCLVGERPEEVTDLAKSLQGEVISSTFDEAISHHTELAEITIERARRLVESGFDVVVLLDSVTRLARAYNLAAPGDSRSLSGGMATSALYPPKRFFGAARALQEGGSLTVIATCLVDTNSRLDDVIYEELKGTGNMELVLDRRLAEERVFPAIDIVKSSTRREELLLQPNELTAVLRLRRALSMGNDPINNTQRIIQQMERTRTNAEFLASLLAQTSGR